MDTGNETYYFLRGDGECVTLARHFDWTATPLGDPSGWSLELRNAVATIFSSKFPMFLWWGQELIQFYNDGYRPSLGIEGKHPLAMGQRGADCWPEIWDFIHPLIEKVMTTGESVWYEDLLLPIFRNGRMEDVYWTFSYSPVYSHEGTVVGVHVVCVETTEKIVGLAEMLESKAELEFTLEAAELAAWDLNPATGKVTANTRLKDWFGLTADDDVPLTLALESIDEPDRPRVLEAINKAVAPGSDGKYDIAYTIIHPVTGQMREVIAKGRARFNDDGTLFRFNGTLEDVTAQVHAQREAAEARQLTDLTIKAVGLGLFKANPLTDEMDYTPEFAYLMTGNAAQRKMSRNAFITHIHPEDQYMRVMAVREGVEKGEFHYEPRVIWADGSVRRLSIVGARVNDAEGNMVALSGVVRDITINETQQKALEEAQTQLHKERRESENFFRNVTDSSPTGLWLSDKDGYITYLNRALIEWTGVRYDELLGGGWLNAIVAEDRQAVQSLYITAIETRTHYDAMFRLRKHDGNIIWCRAGGDPFYDDEGNYAGFSGFCMDIDEIVAGRKAVADSEVLFRSIIEQAPVATCLFVGPKMVISVANNIMIGYWGKDRSVIGKPVLDALPEISTQPFPQILQNVYRTGIAYTDQSAFAQLEVGGEIRDYYFDFTYKPLMNADGEIYGVLNMAVDVTQQVNAQRLIEEQQRRILASFEQAPVGIAMLEGEHFIFRMANLFYCELVDRPLQSIIDKPLMQAIPELEGQGFDELLRSVYTTGIPFTASEVSVKLKRGTGIETIYVDLTYQPQLDASEAVTGILVVATDVTQQVVSRLAVEVNEQKFRSIISDTPMGVALFQGREMIIEVANDILLGYLGKDRSVIGMRYVDAVPELIGQGLVKIMDQVFASGTSYEARDARVDLTIDGQMRTHYYNYSYTPLLDNQADVYAIILTAQDVTEQFVARKKIEDTQKALENAIELAELSTWKLDIQNGRFVYSDRFQDWLGFNDATQSMDEAFNPLPEEYRERVAAAIEAVIRPGADGRYQNEHPIINRITGQQRIIRANAQVYYDQWGSPQFLSGTAQDITKDRKLQQELEFKVNQRTSALREANAELALANKSLESNNLELQQFAYIASHDLQEPVRKITIFTQMLQSQLGPLPAKAQGYLDKIGLSAQRMSVLISDILAFSRLSDLNERFERVDLNDVMAEILLEFELSIEQKSAVIQMEALPVINAIPLQMSQLFGNLLSNSLKYTSEHKKPVIEIFTSPVTTDEVTALHLDVALTYCKIGFRDNGIGFEPEYAEKIFNIFHRLHGKNEYIGTGIGLALCRKIVNNHHGRITASGVVGKGATFWIVIPVSRDQDLPLLSV